jgi:glycosyltransferase involved in cell wall biosynthesis
MRILLVEPWMDGSHRSWAEGYREASSHDVDIIALPGELWRWRLRGGAVPLADQLVEWIGRHGAPDVLLVSGLVDVAELVGMARRSLPSAVPVVVYQHESQLVYPVHEGDYDHGAALRNWVSWCAADLVLFNSYHHLRSVSAALPGFVETLPDDSHRPHLEPVMARFEVCPVGVDLRQVASAGDRQSRSRRSGPPVILWPHRWERDKDPAAFLAALHKLDRAGLDYRLILAGQDPPSGSTYAGGERSRAEREFGHRLAASGSFDRSEYLQHLSDADLVVSCARHEFFGVAVVEAVAAGCLPLLPHALSYPELIRPPWHTTALYQPGTFGTRLIDAVTRVDELRAASVGLAESMHRFSWSSMAQAYDDRLAAVAAERARPETLHLRSVG